MRFIVDVNLSPRFVDALRARGHDAVRVTEILDPRSLDATIVEEAARRDASIITRDQDLSSIVATTGRTKPSIVNLRTSSIDPEHLAHVVDTISIARSQDIEDGCVITIDDRRVRVRRLPVG